MDLRLSGQAAIVTGSSRGIGASIARTLAREGVSVVVNYARDEAGAKAVRAAIEADGGRATVCQGDVGDPATGERLVRHALDHFGRLDILINNAGAMARIPFIETPMEELDRLLNTNLKGTFNCCQAAARHMIRSRYGRILNCSSGAASIGSAGHAAYSASKAAIEALSRVMAGELAPYNILVNVYVPGLFETDMSRPAIERRGSEMVSAIGLRRPGQPEELAALVAFLASPLNSYMTGATVAVNGGKLVIQNPMKPWQDAGL